MDLFDIGEKIKEARKAKKMTQAQLANQVGLSRYTIIQLERGVVPDLGIRKVLRVLAHLNLEMTVDTWVQKPFPTLEDMYEINRKEREVLRKAALRR